MSKRSVGIVGIGAYAPEKVITNFDLEKIVDTSDEWITTRTGIKERHVAAEGQSTSDFAAEAAKTAIERSGVALSDIDLIIAATASPDMMYPSTACLVQHKLGIPETPCFDLQAGCSGFLYGLTVAAQFIAGGTYDTVLVVGAETLSRFLDWEDRSTCVLFGDGGGAALLKAVDDGCGILSYDINANGNYHDILYMPAGGAQMPPSEDTLKEKLHSVKMKGSEVFKQAVIGMEKSCLKILERAGLEPGDIDHFVPHQANIRIIESVGRRLGIESSKVHTNLAHYGNTSCASIPLALNEFYESGDIKKGETVLMTAAGSGFTWGSMILKWCI